MSELEYLTSSAAQQFLADNEHVDPSRLLLNPPREFAAHIQVLADQLISRKKAKGKFPGWHQKSLIYPPPLSVEQASSEKTALYKAGLLSGSHLVDLTGGMGVDTLAFSARFDRVTYVERDEQLSRAFDYNSRLLSTRKIDIKNESAEDFLKTFQSKATFFIDPARRDQQKKVFLFEHCSPNILQLLPGLAGKATQILIKASPLIDLSYATSVLDHLREIHVVSVSNECKEVLLLLDFQHAIQEPQIRCINLSATESAPFVFKLSEEKKLHVSYSDALRYLYDPHASILKAGAFKIITLAYPVTKIAPRTHLYTSDSLITNFPGRIFEVINKKPSKKDLGELDNAHVISKNFPASANELNRKYHLTETGDLYLIAFTDQNRSKQLMITHIIS